MPEPCAECRRYVDALLDAHDKHHRVEQRALEAAAGAVSARLEGMNEFRESLRDATGTYVTREVLDATIRERNVRLDAVTREAQRAAVGAGVVGIVGGFILSRVI